LGGEERRPGKGESVKEQISIPWASAAAQAYLRQKSGPLAGMEPRAIADRVRALAEEHEAWVDGSCLTFYAGTNTMSPMARAMLASSMGTRPSMGHPGDKYQPGVRFLEEVETLAIDACRRLFRARFAEVRLPSGSSANLSVFMALTRAGDRILALPEWAGGHPTHREEGMAGLHGLVIRDVPFDPARMQIDLDGVRRVAKKTQPRLIIVGASLALFPYPLQDVRAIAEEVGALVMYDGAHLAGIIAGGQFQDPLAEGAHLFTSSTYKTLGGPPGGLVLTNDPEIARRIDAVAYPGMTANFDCARVGALAVAAAELLEFGPAYARDCLANAQALARALAAEGFDVVAAARGFTRSHHLAVDVHDLGGGAPVARRLEAANIILSKFILPRDAGGPAGQMSGLRLGLQEVTRRGLGVAEMPAIARLMRRVVLEGENPAAVGAEVRALRQRYARVRYCFEIPETADAAVLRSSGHSSGDRQGAAS
jgi:glycine hydroxymethyltransferase